MRDHLELISTEGSEPPGTAAAILVSLAVHAVLLTLFAVYKPPVAPAPKKDLVRFVEILRQQPQAGAPQFTEAPGAKRDDKPRMNAPFSDANRRASTPRPTGDQPTLRPGDGSRIYTPGDPRPRAPQMAEAARQPIVSPQDNAEESATAQQQAPAFSYQVQKKPPPAAASVNWNSAIREVGKVASLGGDGTGALGGDEGFAESGPISFETQWYEWGDYGQHMVARIRHHWYANMPSLIRMGVRGVVTIQFTIQRNGAITDVRLVRSSDIPPFDFAAQKAIELSSPLNPLPPDFPNSSERVTAQFFYNMNPPNRS